MPLVVVQVSIPVTVLHLIYLIRWTIDGTGNARVSSGSTRKKLEVWSRLVLITLETVI